MAKGAYIGVGGVAKKVKKMYIGVGGVAKKVKKAYIGVGGVAKLFWSGGTYRTILNTSTNNSYYDSNEEAPTTFTQQSITSNSGGYSFKYDPVGQRFYALNKGSSNTKIYYTTSIEGTTWTYAGQVTNGRYHPMMMSVDPTDGTLMDLYGASAARTYMRKITVSSSGVSTKTTTNYAQVSSSASGVTRIKRVGSYYAFLYYASSSIPNYIFYTTDFTALTSGNTGGGSGTEARCTTGNMDEDPAIYYNGSEYVCYRALSTSSSKTIQRTTSSNLTFSGTYYGRAVSTSDLYRCIGDNIDGTDAVFNIVTAASSGFNSVGTWNWSGKISSSSIGAQYDNVYGNVYDGTRIFHINTASSVYTLYYATNTYVWTAVTLPVGANGLARAAV